MPSSPRRPTPPTTRLGLPAWGRGGPSKLRGVWLISLAVAVGPTALLAAAVVEAMGAGVAEAAPGLGGDPG